MNTIRILSSILLHRKTFQRYSFRIEKLERTPVGSIFLLHFELKFLLEIESFCLEIFYLSFKNRTLKCKLGLTVFT